MAPAGWRRARAAAAEGSRGRGGPGELLGEPPALCCRRGARAPLSDTRELNKVYFLSLKLL